MKTIINTSFITDYSGEPPIITYSNPVTTVVNDPTPAPVITRFFYRLCDCCDCCDCCDVCPDYCGCWLNFILT